MYFNIYTTSIRLEEFLRHISIWFKGYPLFVDVY